MPALEMNQSFGTSSHCTTPVFHGKCGCGDFPIHFLTKSFPVLPKLCLKLCLIFCLIGGQDSRRFGGKLEPSDEHPRFWQNEINFGKSFTKLGKKLCML